MYNDALRVIKGEFERGYTFPIPDEIKRVIIKTERSILIQFLKIKKNKKILHYSYRFFLLRDFRGYFLFSFLSSSLQMSQTEDHCKIVSIGT